MNEFPVPLMTSRRSRWSWVQIPEPESPWLHHFLYPGGLAPCFLIHGPRERQVRDATCRSAARGPFCGRGLRHRLHGIPEALQRGARGAGLQPSLEVAGTGIFRIPGAPPEVLALPEMKHMDDVAVPIEAPHTELFFSRW